MRCSKCDIETDSFIFKKDGSIKCINFNTCKYRRSKGSPKYKLKSKKRSANKRNKAIQYVTDYLKEHPCIDCGERDMIVLDFDHINAVDKKYTISRLVSRGAPLSKLIIEIEKCAVRCSNCHRRRTAIQMGTFCFKIKAMAGEQIYIAPVSKIIMNKEKADAVRIEYKTGILQKDLSIKYNVSLCTISSIINFKTWK